MGGGMGEGGGGREGGRRGEYGYKLHPEDSVPRIKKEGNEVLIW